MRVCETFCPIVRVELVASFSDEMLRLSLDFSSRGLFCMMEEWKNQFETLKWFVSISYHILKDAWCYQYSAENSKKREREGQTSRLAANICIIWYVASIYPGTEIQDLVKRPEKVDSESRLKIVTPNIAIIATSVIFSAIFQIHAPFPSGIFRFFFWTFSKFSKKTSIQEDLRKLLSLGWKINCAFRTANAGRAGDDCAKMVRFPGVEGPRKA